ncbi:hypothetical protein B0B24_27895 [Pseudomonas aeruginosa]|nr:hypothetical protein HW00_27055 [Pseudomonas aeruginosa]ALZ32533.1 hypothetical protein HV94_17010 [Pseudomonas aeruginosa]ONM69596.1 hypothetical protein B0B24_27895 [Pseudomonas aeruginosa]ONM72643.1 hypothetical protein B0B25_27095 [Pseudomonas aeruginosa]OOH05053.1 hypothetical protein B0B33_26880 [Pseudomonas aeruginosa]
MPASSSVSSEKIRKIKIKVSAIIIIVCIQGIDSFMLFFNAQARANYFFQPCYFLVKLVDVANNSILAFI